jgi:uncharacterized protein (DUF1800 family)
MLEAMSAGGWNTVRAAHLLNRAGFGGTPAAVAELVRLGPAQAVSLLVDYERCTDPTPDPDWAKPDPGRAERLRAMRQAPEQQRRQMQREEQQLQRQRMLELRGWWLQRMATGPRPFQEKMTLFWHGHFATSVVKVREAYYMWRQNELFRRLATGNWLQLLIEAGKDPAMLIWLDQGQSRREHPNENYAREVMELFTLGEGHYSEKDVTEAARAFTGWSLDRVHQRFIERPMWHDQGTKTVLGRTGDLDGEEVLEQIVAQPQAALFITAKLWNFFAGVMPGPALNAALANVFRRSGNQFKPLLRTMFLSEEFYRPEVIGNQVKSPVQWLVGSVRMLEIPLPPPIVSSNLIRNLGQDLFAPPNVKGWDGGLAWISTNSLLARYNEAATLVRGDPAPVASMVETRKPNQTRMLQRRMKRLWLGGVQVEKLVLEDERADTQALLTALETRLLQARLAEKQEAVLGEYLNSKGTMDDEVILGAIRLIMCTPEYQVT